MNLDEAYSAMEDGKRIRRPSWIAGRSMHLDNEGIEITTDASGKTLSKGYREFESCTDYELYEASAATTEHTKEKTSE